MTQLLTGTGWGRTIALRGSAASISAARPQLPFWWEDSSDEPDQVFELSEPAAAPLVLRTVERWMAEHASGVVFVHAAVVAFEGTAVVLPGTSFSGKTTLCVELLRRGATYLSDEYAVLDRDGQVRPYPRSLQVRVGDDRVARTAQSLGAVVGCAALPVGLFALLTHDATSGWSIRDASPSDAVLRVLEHTVAARSRPAAAVEAVHAAVTDARVVHGSRGPAADAIDPLLALLRRT